MDQATPTTREYTVHCCACSRLVTLQPTDGPGSVVTCPFCGTRQVLRELTVFVSEPVVPA